MSRFDEHKHFIKQYIQQGKNIMLAGKHGVGKTALINTACKELGLTVWYASAPLLDPDIDFGGIPVPNKKTGSLDFFTKPELFKAEVLFLDELNRASPRTLNMLFEIVQFHSIHGKVLPNLKAVVTGINPPGAGAYDVQTLDDALMDRFQAFLAVDPEYPRSIVEAIVGDKISAKIESWWTESLTQCYVSPRRLEYLAYTIKAGMPIEHAFTDPKVPVGRLREMLASILTETAGLAKQKEPWEEIWLEPQMQELINHPKLQDDMLALEKALAEHGITPEMVYKKLWEMRQAGEV